jgi:WD40 repeat protein
VDVWEAATGTWRLTLDPSINLEQTKSVFFGNGDQRIYTTETERLPKVWDIQTGKLLFDLEKLRPDQSESIAFLMGHPKPMHLSVALSPDGQTIVTGSDFRTRLWNANSGELLQTLQGHRAAIEWVTYSQDGQRLLTASFDGSARVWRAADGQELFQLAGHTTNIPRAAFSPQGHLILLADRKKVLRLINGKTGQSIAELVAANQNLLRSVNFSHDGRTAIAVTIDGEVNLWDLTTKELIVTLGAKQGIQVESAEYGADDRELLLLTKGGKRVEIWSLFQEVQAL